MRAFCSGDSFAKMVVSSATVANSSSLISSISVPSKTLSTGSPTFSQTVSVTFSLSPVRIFVVTPCSFNALIAGAAEGFGGSRKAK